MSLNKERRHFYVNSPSEMPDGEHWAIITGTSVFIPGDERSKSCPGHGYPESTEHYISYEAFLDEDEFKRELEKSFLRSDKSCKGIHVEGAYTIKTKIEIAKPKPKVVYRGQDTDPDSSYPDSSYTRGGGWVDPRDSNDGARFYAPEKRD